MSYYIARQMKPHETKEGWWWVKFDNESYDNPGDPYWSVVSPKLRVWQYPGGPAEGQLSKADFDYLTKAWHERAKTRYAPELEKEFAGSAGPIDPERYLQSLRARGENYMSGELINGIPYSVLVALVRVAAGLPKV